MFPQKPVSRTSVRILRQSSFATRFSVLAVFWPARLLNSAIVTGSIFGAGAGAPQQNRSQLLLSSLVVVVVEKNSQVSIFPVCDCSEAGGQCESLASGGSREQQMPPTNRHVVREESCAASDPIRPASFLAPASRIADPGAEPRRLPASRRPSSIRLQGAPPPSRLARVAATSVTEKPAERAPRITRTSERFRRKQSVARSGARRHRQKMPALIVTQSVRAHAS